MTLETTLERSFNAYLAVARSSLRPQKVKAPRRFPFQLLRDKTIELRSLVDGIEGKSEFIELVNQTLTLFPSKRATGQESSTLERFGEIRNFFRRSRCYTSIYAGQAVATEPILRQLETEFRREEFRIRYLVPLRFIDFCDYEDLIEFKRFKIRRFSSEELNYILQSDVNQIFYEWNNIEVSKIQPYWFIDVEGFESSTRRPRGLTFDLGSSVQLDEDVISRIDIRGSNVNVSGEELSKYFAAQFLFSGPGHIAVHSDYSAQDEFSAFPTIVGEVFQPIILFDWDSVWEPLIGPRSLYIPFVLEISDDIMSPPRSIPETTPFQFIRVPPANTEIESSKDSSGSYSVELLSEESEEVEPFYALQFHGGQSGDFVSFVAQTDSILTRLRASNSEWRFLELSFLFLSKAFFSTGLQQLLWHITALESLLGQKKEGLTETIAARLALVLGKTQEERDEIRKSFKDAYNLRSRLVHGNEDLLKKKTTVKHLCEARDLARRTFLWFLYYLNHVLEHTSVSERSDFGLPTREELLSMLDLKENRNRSNRIKHLQSILPADFPRPANWVESSRYESSPTELV
jgi:hypothetical protein